MNSHEVFIHIHQGCFAGTGAIVRLPQCQWSKPDGYGKISQCITTTKHSKAKTVCIFLGIYCTSVWRTIRTHYNLMRWIDTFQTVVMVGPTLVQRRDDSTGVGPTFGQPPLLPGQDALSYSPWCLFTWCNRNTLGDINWVLRRPFDCVLTSISRLTRTKPSTFCLAGPLFLGIKRGFRAKCASDAQIVSMPWRCCVTR